MSFQYDILKLSIRYQYLDSTFNFSFDENKIKKSLIVGKFFINDDLAILVAII